jgi:hypothetical protein
LIYNPAPFVAEVVAEAGYGWGVIFRGDYEEDHMIGQAYVKY